MKTSGLVLTLICCSFLATAQTETTLATTADTDTLFSKPLFGDSLLTGRNWLVLLHAQLNVSMGMQAAGPATEAKFGGLFMKFRVTEVAGVPVPDSRKPMHIMPFGLVVETSGNYKAVNTLAELGYRYGLLGSGPFRLPKRAGALYAELTTQVGCRFGWTTTADSLTGQQMLGRVKGYMVYHHPAILTITPGITTGIKAGAALWYDVMRNRFYQQWNVAMQLRMGSGRVWQVWYGQGSGAPLFSPLPQWGLGMELSR